MTFSEAPYPRTAFMIVAHNNPDLFARLVARLQAPWAHVVALIDAKADQHVFEQAVAGHRITFVSSECRVDVRWGGIGLTTAAIRMMREAVERFSPDRFVMMSGADYPIKPTDQIGRRLSGDVQLVRVDRTLDGRRSGIHDDFVRYHHFNDTPWLNPRSSAVPHLQRVATRTLRVLPRKQLSNMALFHGCGWWSITAAAAEWVLRRADERPDVFDWLKHANCPDEIFMQTMLKSSPYASDIAQDYTLRETALDDNVHGCHYIDWSQPNSSSPKTLELSDLPLLVRSSALFARKIDPICSGSLLTALDRYLEDQVANEIGNDGCRTRS